MPIIITTNDDSGQQQEEVYQTREDFNKKTVQSPAQKAETVEKDTDASVAEESDNNEDDESFNYLKSKDEDEDNNDEHDDDIEDSEDEDEEVETRPKKNGVQKRIDKLTKEKAELKKRLADYEREKSNPTQQPATNQVKVEDLKEPVFDDFDTNADYLKALAKYEVNEERKKFKIEQEQDAVRQEVEKIQTVYRARVEEAKARYGSEKWESLAEINLPLSNPMQQVIMSIENGPDILYYLYHNLETNNKINNMTPIEQVMALKDLSYKVNEKLKGSKKPEVNKTKISNAPAPIKTINSKTDGKTSKSLDEMSYQEHKAYMEKLAKSKR